MNEKRILNSKEVTEFLGVSEFTIQRTGKAKSDLYAKTGEGKFMGPKFIIRGTRSVVYMILMRSWILQKERITYYDGFK